MLNDSIRLKVVFSLLLILTLSTCFLYAPFDGANKSKMDEIDIRKANEQLDSEIKTLFAHASTLESKLKTENVLSSEATEDNKKLKEKEELHAIYKGTRWLDHLKEYPTTGLT